MREDPRIVRDFLLRLVAHLGPGRGSNEDLESAATRLMEMYAETLAVPA